MRFDRKTRLRNDGSKGHLMLVCDTGFINGELSPLVTSDGFKIVATAKGCSDTLCLYNEQCDDIDLVLIDVDIPNQDGIALLEKILAADTDARIIVIVSREHPHDDEPNEGVHRLHQ